MRRRVRAARDKEEYPAVLAASGRALTGPEAATGLLPGSAQPPPRAVSRLGHDFSRVRIHSEAVIHRAVTGSDMPAVVITPQAGPRLARWFGVPNPTGLLPNSQKVPGLLDVTVQQVEKLMQAGKYQEAIDLTVSAGSGAGTIDPSLLHNGTMQFNPALRQEGETTRPQIDPQTRKREEAKVEIGPPAFQNGVSWLYSTMCHEFVHVQQFQPNLGQVTTPDEAHTNEVHAYAYEIEHATETGLGQSPNLVEEVWKRLQHHFNRLMSVRKRSVQAKVDAAFRKAQQLVGPKVKLTPP